ncbi:hypothetical protein REJC140_00408 [Pseudorhizobium endolithicum]|uniref:Uncharacterized protein n=1 Tax=Pseudorhizobium endolithicum TaxID=1191678 RepID=A0ABM8PE35_9HYPH|nr:hypothetical protein [Pseudorhizobium endolithicum]CAD6410518.1 hypothetical protein REQ54_00754 [Rhizobium sp. Q54]CAD7024029.1 hypothetical protein REJC140_00408 [Pseudorhizobium endolithicum]
MTTLSQSTAATAPSIQTSPSHSLRPLLVTVFTAKVVVSAFLLATVSFAPPVSANGSYMATMN